MDRRERFADAVEQFRSAFEGMQSEMWTALPGVIDYVDFEKQTCRVQPAVMALATAQDGTKSWIEIPLLVDCPLFFPSGGGFTLTFPVAPGDECLVVFASRCIDNWAFQQGDTGPSGHSRSQAELRMHDLSDGFAFVGFRNQNRLVSDISTRDVQLRSDAGTAVISIRDTSDVYVHSDANVIVDADQNVNVSSRGNVTVVTPGEINATCGSAVIASTGSISLEAPMINLASANVVVTGNLAITGALTLDGLPFNSHHHAPGTLKAGSTNVTGTSGGVTP